MDDDKRYNVNTCDIEEAMFIINNLYYYDNTEFTDILDEYENKEHRYETNKRRI